MGNPVSQGKGGLSYTAVKITPCSLHNDFVVSEPDLPEKSKQSSIKGSNHTQLSKDFVYRQMTLEPTNYCCCQFNHFLDLKMIILKVDQDSELTSERGARNSFRKSRYPLSV